MSFTGNEDHSISLTAAAHLTANYRASVATGSTIGHFFGKDAISDILAQTDCVGIRIYYGLKDDGEKQLVICGVTANGDDLYNGELAERSFICPTDCATNNPLNS
jgi:hypothetical protein